METYRMRKFYWSMLSEVSLYYNINKEDIHEMLKTGYYIQSTVNLNYNEWYDYIDKVHYFMAWVFDMYFDTDRYKYENISFTRLYWSERPDNFYLLF